MDNDLLDIELPIDVLTPKQHEIFDVATDMDNYIDYVVVSTGRQVGKSTVGHFVSFALTLRDDMYKVGFFEPTYRQCGEQFKRMCDMLVGMKGLYNTNKSEMLIEFINGSSIRFITSENDSSRGFTFDYIIVDEACFVKNEIFESSILPTVAISIGEKRGKCLLLSTPKDKNWFYSYYKSGIEDDSDTYSINFTSYEGGLYSKEFLDNVKNRTNPVIFNNEYMGEFVEGGSGLFPYSEHLLERTVKYTDQRCVAAIDWGMENDYTVLTIITLSKDIVLIKRWKKMKWEMLINDIVKILRKYNNPIVHSEVNGIGQMPTQVLRERYSNTRSFTTTNKTKTEIILKLSEDIGLGVLRIPKGKDYEWLRQELDDFEFKYENGLMKFSGRGSRHDDGVMSLAIANHNCIDRQITYGNLKSNRSNRGNMLRRR